jgi:hypothetical protein
METKQFVLNENLSQKMTDWTREPTLQDLKNDLLNAKQHHDSHMAKVDNWNNLLHARGGSKPPMVKGRSSVQPKLVRRQAEWRYSALTEPFLGTDKMFDVQPITFEDANSAEQNAKVLNYQFRTKINRVKFIDDFVRSTVDEGTSIIKVGWKRSMMKVEQTVPIYDHYPIEQDQDIKNLQDAVAMKAQDPRTYEDMTPPEIKAAVDYYEETGTGTVCKQNGTKKVMVDKVLENFPTAEVLRIKNVFLDPSCNGDFEKALFVIVSFEPTKADLVKEGKRYSNLDMVDWEGSTPANDPEHATGTPIEFALKGARKRVVAYEYWGFYDIHGDDCLVPFVATWIGSTLIRMELNPFPDQKLPFVVVPYLPIKHSLYGEPDAELLEDNQKILGAITRGLIDLLGRSANGQQGFAKGMLDPLNRRRFDDGKDYEFNPNMPPANGHMQHKYPEFPQSALQMLNLQNMDAESLSGVKSFAGGISGQAYGDVAAGAKGAMDAAAKREMAILRRLAKGMSEIGQKFSTMNQVFLSDKETIRITNVPYVGKKFYAANEDANETEGGEADDKKMVGHNGGPKMEDQFETISRDDLAGSFDFSVDISTAEVDNAKAQDLAFMLQTMGPNMDLGMTLMILSEIAELKRMPALAQKIRSYAPKPDPMAQQKMQLEIEQLSLTNKKLQSEIDLNEAKAKASTNMADKANLDFVQQQDGTTHARQMAHAEAQADGNKDLEVTKALLKARKPDETPPNIEAAVGYNALTKDKSANAAQPTPAPVDIPQNLSEQPQSQQPIAPQPGFPAPEGQPGADPMQDQQGLPQSILAQ